MSTPDHSPRWSSEQLQRIRVPDVEANVTIIDVGSGSAALRIDVDDALAAAGVILGFRLLGSSGVSGSRRKTFRPG